jgi:integrase
MRFTATNVKNQVLRKGTSELIIFDDDTPGFGLRLREGGARTWIVQFKVGKQHRRMTLGSTTLLDLTKARASARDVLAKVRLGEDPQAQKQQARVMASETFGRYLDAYLEWKQPQVRPNSFREIERYLRRYAKAWHTRPLASITQRDAADLVDTITTKHGGPSANRANAAIGPYFGWLLGKGRVDANPFAYVPKATENGSRERVLSDSELAAIWHAAGDENDQFGVIVKLLLLTGARRAEIGDLRWSEYRDGMITIPAERSKNRREHEIILSRQAREILESRPQRNSTDFVFGQRDDAGFSGWSKAKVTLDAQLAATGTVRSWTLHDLRRTMATGLAERLQVEPHVIEAVLNHVSGFRAGVAGVYNRALYREPKADALQRWADHVQAVIIDNANEPKRSQRSGPLYSNHGVRHGRSSEKVEA